MKKQTKHQLKAKGMGKWKKFFETVYMAIKVELLTYGEVWAVANKGGVFVFHTKEDAEEYKTYRGW